MVDYEAKVKEIELLRLKKKAKKKLSEKKKQNNTLGRSSQSINKNKERIGFISKLKKGKER